MGRIAISTVNTSSDNNHIETMDEIHNSAGVTPKTPIDKENLSKTVQAIIQNLCNQQHDQNYTINEKLIENLNKNENRCIEIDVIIQELPIFEMLGMSRDKIIEALKDTDQPHMLYHWVEFPQSELKVKNVMEEKSVPLDKSSLTKKTEKEEGSD